MIARDTFAAGWDTSKSDVPGALDGLILPGIGYHEWKTEQQLDEEYVRMNMIEKVVRIVVIDQADKVPTEQRFTAIADIGSGGGWCRTGATVDEAVEMVCSVHHIPRGLPVEIRTPFASENVLGNESRIIYQCQTPDMPIKLETAAS